MKINDTLRHCKGNLVSLRGGTTKQSQLRLPRLLARNDKRIITIL